MNVKFKSSTLDRLETDRGFNGGFDVAVVKAYRKRMMQIRAAEDERTLSSLRSLNFEKLKGKRKHEHSMRLNDQWRLIVRIEKSTPKNTIIVVGIENYHK